MNKIFCHSTYPVCYLYNLFFFYLRVGLEGPSDLIMAVRNLVGIHMLRIFK